MVSVGWGYASQTLQPELGSAIQPGFAAPAETPMTCARNTAPHSATRRIVAPQWPAQIPTSDKCLCAEVPGFCRAMRRYFMRVKTVPGTRPIGFLKSAVRVSNASVDGVCVLFE